MKNPAPSYVPDYADVISRHHRKPLRNHKASVKQVTDAIGVVTFLVLTGTGIGLLLVAWMDEGLKSFARH